MYLLDTDTVSLHQRGHPAVVQRLSVVVPEEVHVCTVTIAEQMRGCWNAVNRARDDMQLVAAYDLDPGDTVHVDTGTYSMVTNTITRTLLFL